jgi:solute carrier family 25 phosphate transporter 23/24/25/41
MCIQYYMHLYPKIIQLFTFVQVTYPLDVLRLRLAVEPGYRTMSEVWYWLLEYFLWQDDHLWTEKCWLFVQIALTMLREEGVASFYYGLGPSLLGIAPYIAVNFCIFDLWAH